MKEFIDKLISRLGKESDEWFERFMADSKKGHYNEYADGSDDAFDEAISIVNQLAEEYKVSEMPTGWISVSERLPEEAGDYLVTQYTEKSIFDYCDAYRVSTIFFDDKNGWWDDIDNSCGWNIIAWMPLPAPYTEGE